MFFEESKIKKTKARLVRRAGASCLIAAFGDGANESALWQANLDRAESLKIVLREKEGLWELGTEDEAGFHPVASFDEPDSARQALAAVRRALLRTDKTTREGGRSSLLLWVLVILVAGSVAMSVLGGGAGKFKTDMLPAGAHMQTGSELPTMGGAHPEEQAGAPKTKVEDGVPMSADDVLKAPDEPAATDHP